MSMSEDKASEKEPDAPESDSVFDFLYCDSNRIGSFLAQFDDSGHLERVIQREHVSRGIKRGIELSVGGGAMLAGTGGSGNLGFKRGPSEQGSEGSERVYDPLWANARSFLDYLAEREMIVDDITTASIGQFVKISGILKVVDLSILTRIFENPILAKRIRGEIQKSSNSSENRDQRRENHAAQRATHNPNTPGDVESGFALLTIVGMGTQAIIHDKVATAWANLRKEFLVIPTTDLLLQHGLMITGEWTAVGVLDAKPETSVPSPNEDGVAILDAIGQLVPLIRNVVGRPPTHYGITPLLILREIPV